MATIDKAQDVWELAEEDCYVALTHNHLNAQAIMDRVRSPSAGAIVLFAGKFPSLIFRCSSSSLTLDRYHP
jgi:molybdopterin synthase catalytic subunit